MKNDSHTTRSIAINKDTQIIGAIQKRILRSLQLQIQTSYRYGCRSSVPASSVYMFREAAQRVCGIHDYYHGERQRGSKQSWQGEVRHYWVWATWDAVFWTGSALPLERPSDRATSLPPSMSWSGCWAGETSPELGAESVVGVCTSASSSGQYSM